jgi:hypothetical protein
MVEFLAWLKALFLDILPRIDSSRRHDRHELSDQQILGLSAGLVTGFYLGSTVPGGMIAWAWRSSGSCNWILPWIDSARRHDRHELSDQHILCLSSGLVTGCYLGSTVSAGMIAMSLAISKFRSYYWILPWIDSVRWHDRHELGDRQCFVIGFNLGSTVPGGMIAMSLAIVSVLAWMRLPAWSTPTPKRSRNSTGSTPFSSAEKGKGQRSRNKQLMRSELKNFERQKFLY